jgi:hypothetical protein
MATPCHTPMPPIIQNAVGVPQLITASQAQAILAASNRVRMINIQPVNRQLQNATVTSNAGAITVSVAAMDPTVQSGLVGSKLNPVKLMVRQVNSMIRWTLNG